MFSGWKGGQYKVFWNEGMQYLMRLQAEFHIALPNRKKTLNWTTYHHPFSVMFATLLIFAKQKLSNFTYILNRQLEWLHAIQFAKLATVNFLHSIHLAKVATVNSSNAVLAGQICSAKTANSGTRLTIIHSGISGSDVSSIHEWN